MDMYYYDMISKKKQYFFISIEEFKHLIDKISTYDCKIKDGHVLL